jgi:pleiotropic regulator 1
MSLQSDPSPFTPVQFFDYTSGIPFQTLDDIPQPGSLDAESGIMASTFDRTGTRLLTGCCDKSIKVWKEES